MENCINNSSDRNQIEIKMQLEYTRKDVIVLEMFYDTFNNVLTYLFSKLIQLLSNEQRVNGIKEVCQDRSSTQPKQRN